MGEKQNTGRNLLLRCFLYIAVLYVGTVCAMSYFQRSLLYYPDNATYTQNEMGVAGFTDIAVTTDDDLTLHSWYAPARAGNATFIVFHGNGGSFHSRAPAFAPLMAAGYGVLLAEYRGFGGNPGHPSEKGLYADADAYIRYATGTLRIPPKKIVLYGESLGTGIAVEMATHHKGLGALILESPFTSMAKVTSYHYPFIPFPKYLVRDHYDSESKIEALTLPILIFAGGRDNIVPSSMGQALYDLAKAPGKTIRIYPNANHNDIRSHGTTADLITFLKKL